MDEDRSLAQLLALLLALLQSSNVEDDGGPSKCRQRPCASVTQERGQCPQESAAHIVCGYVCACVYLYFCMIVSHKSAAHILCVCYSFCTFHFFFYFMLFIFLPQVLHKGTSSALKSHWHANTVCVLLRTRRSSLLPMTALF